MYGVSSSRSNLARAFARLAQVGWVQRGFHRYIARTGKPVKSTSLCLIFWTAVGEQLRRFMFGPSVAGVHLPVLPALACAALGYGLRNGSLVSHALTPTVLVYLYVCAMIAKKRLDEGNAWDVKISDLLSPRVTRPWHRPSTLLFVPLVLAASVPIAALSAYIALVYGLTRIMWLAYDYLHVYDVDYSWDSRYAWRNRLAMAISLVWALGVLACIGVAIAVGGPNGLWFFAALGGAIGFFFPLAASYDKYVEVRAIKEHLTEEVRDQIMAADSLRARTVQRHYASILTADPAVFATTDPDLTEARGAIYVAMQEIGALDSPPPFLIQMFIAIFHLVKDSTCPLISADELSPRQG